MSKRHTFRAIIEDAGSGGAFVTIPFDVEQVFGKRRVKVKATLGGEPYQGSLVRMGGASHMLGVRKDIRARLGKAVGDEIEVVLEEDVEPRVAAVPADLQQALNGDPAVWARFQQLSYTHQKEYVQWITDAKRDQTRQARIGQTLQLLKQAKEGRSQPAGPTPGRSRGPVGLTPRPRTDARAPENIPGSGERTTMAAASVQPGTIDAYIADFPPEVQVILEKVRATIRKAAPDAQETIKYRIPTFTLKGNLVHFAAFQSHLGFYPTPTGMDQFQKELSIYKRAKGSVQFPLDQPIPYALISKIVKFRVKESLEKAPAKRKK